MTNKIREEKITKKKKHNPTTQPDLTQPKDVWIHEFLNLL